MEFEHVIQSEVSLLNRNSSINFDEESISIAEFFEVIFFQVKFIQNFVKILLSLSLRFSDDNEYVINNKNYEFFFTEDKFLKATEKITIKDFKKCNH